MNIENITSKGISLDRNGQSMQREIYEREIVKLQSNWNSLKECIEKQREHYSYFKDTRYRTFLSNLLDKMNELEGIDKE